MLRSAPTEDPRPHAWVLCARLGQHTKPYLWRQIVSMETVRPTVVTWRYIEQEGTRGDFAVETLPYEVEPDDGPNRWTVRARNVFRGNYFAAVGDEQRHLDRLLEKDRPDVILAHCGHFALRVLPLAEKHGIPVVAYFHGHDVLPMTASNRWYRSSIKRALPRFAACVIVGEYMRPWMLERGVEPERIHRIPCGAPRDEYRPADRPERDEVVFLSVGSLLPHKGIGPTLRAFARLASTHSNVRYAVAGDGPEREALHELARELGIEHLVDFRGLIAPAEVLPLLHDADVFVLHSSREGASVSISEASLCGLPVVSTDNTGQPDQITHGESGFLTPFGDVDALAESMERLAEDPGLRRRMGAAGRAFAAEHFDSTRLTHRLEDVLVRAAEAARVASR
jgi:colanic acid/amylovoran biosynthesis glycosyltransferase